MDDYDDNKDFDEEELYVANEDDEEEGYNGNGDNYFYEELEEPNLEPLRLNEALLDIGWMCGDPMPDYAHVVFAAVK